MMSAPLDETREGAMKPIFGHGDEEHLPHLDDAIKQAEHLAALRLVADERSTGTAEGLSSALTVSPRSRLVVPVGKTLTINSDTSALDIDWIRVDGRLEFSTTPAVLRATTLVINTSGSFIIPESPSVRRILFSFRGGRNRVDDPADFSGGLISHSKNVKISGESKTAFARPEAITLGSNQLKVTVQNWKVGDQLLIPGIAVNSLDEFPIIAGVNGTTITLDRAIAREHQFPDGTFPVIGNLTRSVIFESENKELSQRAHLMVMHETTGTELKHCSFIGMGRTDANKLLSRIKLDAAGNFISGDENTIGRYAIHFHGRTGAFRGTLPHVVDSCVVIGSPRHGVVNHGSHVSVRNTISTGCVGSAFFGENGLEIGDFTNNLAVGSSGRTAAITRVVSFAALDFGAEGHGIWLQGGQIDVRGNQLYRNKLNGIEIVGTEIPEVGSEGFPVANLRPGPLKTGYETAKRTHVTVSLPQIFEDNTIAGSTNGIQTSNLQFKAGTIIERTRILRNVCYNVLNGVNQTYTSGVDLEDCRFYGRYNIDGSAGGLSGNVNWDQFKVRRCHFEGFPVGCSMFGVTEAIDISCRECVADIQLFPDVALKLERIQHLGKPNTTAKYKTKQKMPLVDYAFFKTGVGTSPITIDNRPIHFVNAEGLIPLNSNYPAWIKSPAKRIEVHLLDGLKPTDVNVQISPVGDVLIAVKVLEAP